MKALILLIFSCASVLGADPGISVVSTVRTNESGSAFAKDVFTRDGQTNLVRDSKTTAGKVEIRVQRFYHEGSLVGDFITMKDSFSFTSEAGSPYSVGFQFGPSNEVISAAIGTKDGTLLDAFTCTNGVFCPAESSLIRKANEIGGDVSKLLSPAHVTNTTPAEFRHEVEEFLEKHHEK
jgi:hypothetical protein